MVYSVAEAMGSTLITGVACTIEVVPKVLTEPTISVVVQVGAVEVATGRVAVVGTPSTAVISRTAASVVNICKAMVSDLL